jgi:predicted nucleic acid-binding protein
VIVVDSGVLVAVADADDAHHLVCTRLLDERGDEFVVPAPVVVEVSWILGRHVSAQVESSFLASLAEGELRVEDLEEADYGRMAELVESYSDLRLGQSMPQSSPWPKGWASIRWRPSTAGTSPSSGRATSATSSWCRTSPEGLAARLSRVELVSDTRAAFRPLCRDQRKRRREPRGGGGIRTRVLRSRSRPSPSAAGSGLSGAAPLPAAMPPRNQRMCPQRSVGARH